MVEERIGFSLPINICMTLDCKPDESTSKINYSLKISAVANILLVYACGAIAVWEQQVKQNQGG